MEQFSQFIMNHWMLCLAFIILLLLTLAYEFITQNKQAKNLSPAAAVALINDEQALVIDLRDKTQYKAGHIIHALNASPQDFEGTKMNQYKKKKLILVCERGLQAANLAAKIQKQGFEALVLNGGITAWQSADLPLVKENH